MKGMSCRRGALVSFGILVILGAAPFSVAGQERPVTEAAAVQVDVVPAEADQAPAETIHPGPQNLKEKWAIGVFLAWMWFSIAVFVYLIRLQIREADRITELGYDDPIQVHRNKRAP